MALYNILFDIAARTAKFEEGMTRVDRRLEGLQRSAGKVGQSLRNLFVVGAAASFIKSTAAAGDEMLNLAERTGRTVESVSQLSHVADRGNTTIEALTKSQDQLAKRLGATDEEGKAAAKALAELGLEAGKIRHLSFDQRLDEIADAMGGIEDPTQRARIEMALFGKAGTELDAVLRDGAGGIRELREEADRFGITVTDIEAERLRKLDDQLDVTAGQFNKLKLEIAGVFAPYVGSYFELVNKGLVGWRVLLNATGEEMEELNERSGRLVLERAKLLDQQRQWDSSDRTKERLAAIREEFELIRERQDYLVSEGAIRARYEQDVADLRSKAAAAAEEAAKKTEADAKAAEKAAEAYAKYKAEIREVIEQYTFMNSLGPPAILSDAELESSMNDTTRMLEEQAEKNQKVFDEMYEKNSESFGNSLGEMTVYAEQAFRNIQDYLADFLFDPFDKGIKGMLRGFINVLRRMMAEIAAAQLLGGAGGGGLLGALSSGLGALFGSGGSKGGGIGVPTLASGGFLQPGQLGIVGEEGPEFAVAGRAGATIIPMSKGGRGASGGGISVTVDARTTVHAPGATMEFAKQLPSILEAHAQRTVALAEAHIVDGLRRQRYNLA